MPDIFNSIGGVSRIEFYNDEGQVMSATDVPEELANDPRIFAHDTAEPYGVLDNYDTSEQVLWNVTGYVESRMHDIERARQMGEDARKLNVELDQMVGRLNGLKQDTSEHRTDRWYHEGMIFHTDEDKWRARIIGGAQLVYHEGGCTDDHCICWDPYYTGSQLELDLRALSKKMDEFFDKYGWEKNRIHGYAKPPQELVAFLSKSNWLNHREITELQKNWDRIAGYIKDTSKIYIFEEAFFIHKHTNIEIHVPNSAPYIRGLPD